MCCPFHNPVALYVGAYGQGVPPYLMDATGQAVDGWDTDTSFALNWEDRSDYNADIWIVPYWQNWTSAPKNPPGDWNAQGECHQLDGSGQWCVRGEVDLNMDNNTTGSWLFLNQGASMRNLQTNTIEHEIGHTLGLDHSCVNAQIMTGPQSNCPSMDYYQCGQYNQPACPTTPQNDDIQGVNALYPQGHSNGHSCAGTAPPVNPNTLPIPVATPSLVPSAPPLPTATVPPLALPPVADGPAITVPDIVPTTPTPIPGPVSSDPTQYYLYVNGMNIAQQTGQNVVYPAQLGEAEAYNQVARANGLWPGGQRVHVAPLGTDNLPAAGAADVNFDATVPTVTSPC